ATEFASLVEAQGGRSIVGTTSSPESVPYQPLVEALRRGLPYMVHDEIDPVWLSVVSALLPELRAAVPSLREPDRIDPKRAKGRLHEALVRIFEAMARTRPLVVIFEDLHWAHAETIEAIELLARRTGALPLLLVCTYRADGVAPGHPLRALRRALVQERLAATIALSRLSRDDVERLVAEMPESLAAAVAEPIHRRSEGNALFVWQLVRGFLETGALPEEIGDAGGVAKAIVARLDRLDQSVRAVADVASTIGRAFTADLVAEVGRWEYEDVLDALGELIDRHLVREAAGAGFDYEFSHGLIADAVYARTPPRDRAPRHARIAQALEASSSGDRPAWSSIARHWKLGGDRERAAQAYARAARAALDVYARAEAIEDAQEALELSDIAAVRFRFEVLRTLVKAEEHYASVDRWKAHIDAMQSCAAALDDDARYEALAARERYFAQVGERGRQREILDSMLALARAQENPHREAVAFGLHGEVTAGLGAFAEARDQFRAALEAARGLNDRLLLGRIRQKYVDMLMRMGEPELAERELEEQRRFVGDSASVEERLNLAWTESAIALAIEEPEAMLRVGNEILELGTSAGDVEEIAKAHWLLGGAYDFKSDTEKVRFHYNEAARLFEQLRQPHSLAATLINLGVHEIGHGLYDRALEYYRRGAEYARQAGSQNVLGFALANAA
ncbi:MAG: AAA family ATPase, partial [Candidatus Eremiobacteraeota bacterium]|nr:AAA family ATPase [Candidatus Eremiobacteraeota bacterium]